ncbi:hypothetical protein [Rhodococcus jostii]|uniref:hypothetical protein n=1 Tax=Rhodococcus jostii TaxID=132919 RepID=UPI0036360272
MDVAGFYASAPSMPGSTAAKELPELQHSDADILGLRIRYMSAPKFWRRHDRSSLGPRRGRAAVAGTS